MTADGIEDLFRMAAARAEIDASLEGRTPEEQRDIVILWLCRGYAAVADQGNAQSALIEKAVAVIGVLERRLNELSAEVTALRAAVVAGAVTRSGGYVSDIGRQIEEGGRGEPYN